MKRDGKPKRRASEIVRTVVGILALVVGLALVLYPTVADKINDAVNQKVIGEYQRQLQAVDNGAYEAMLQDVATYNDRLFKAKPYIGELTSEEWAKYESLLNLDGTGIMGYIEVPKANIYLAIYHGTDENVLQTGVGHLEASSLPLPGESVHTVLTGHSGLPSARLFTDLDQLEIGDTFVLHILNEVLTYRVERMARVSPEELEDMKIEEGQELCTLMTCTPYGINTHRLVVTGRRIETPSTPAEEPEQPLVIQPFTSKWNRWFLLFPTVLFVGIVVTVIIVHRKRKHKKAARESRRGEGFRS